VPGEIETEAQKAELRVMFRDDSSFDCWLVVLQPS
jgi:hypothetical protein